MLVLRGNGVVGEVVACLYLCSRGHRASDDLAVSPMQCTQGRLNAYGNTPGVDGEMVIV